MARIKKTAKSGSDPWLQKAKEAYDTSTSYMDTNYRKVWDDNIRHFQNRHASGSKYYSDSYKYRSRGFRPKTRTFVRSAESAAAGAFFTQLETVSLEPQDDKNPIQKASAELRQVILNYRLNFTIPWFQICVGGMQDASVNGAVCSKQWWDYEEREEEQLLTQDGMPVFDESGEPAVQKVMVKTKDEPCIKLYPLENIRFSPAAIWTDPVNSSPYFIAIEPMFICDVKYMMESGKFAKVDDATLRSSIKTRDDSTKQEREPDRENAYDPRFSKELGDFDIVFIHENFLKIKGKDYHYYTLDTSVRLTEPKPIEKVYLHGIRPFAFGTNVIESHRPIPDSLVHLSKPLQKEANEISNSRQDNVKLVLNKRYFGKRGRQIDLQSLVRNAPGSVTLMTDPDTDVKVVDFADVTPSAYAEQDRVNVDMDDLLGSFSSGTIQTNRKLGETVGGMAMLRSGTNSLTQYLIRVFSETWVEEVLRQLDKLEQNYESDMEFLNLMGRKASLMEKYKIPEVTEELLMQPVEVNVNVTNSATDPMIRLEQFNSAIRNYVEIVQIAKQSGINDLDMEAVKGQIFGYLGFRDGRKFTVNMDNMPPQMAQLMGVLQEQQQVIQQLQKAIEDKQIEKGMEMQAKMELEALNAENERILEAMRQENENMRQNKQLTVDLVKADRDNEVKTSIASMQAHLQAVSKMLSAKQQTRTVQ